MSLNSSSAKMLVVARERVVGIYILTLAGQCKVTKLYVRRRRWEASPERVIAPYTKTYSLCRKHPSSMEHVKFCVNPPRPLGKAKYFSTPIVHSTVRER